MTSKATFCSVAYRLLEKCLEASEDIRLQDAIIVWNEIPSNIVGSRVAFNYIRNKWSTIYDKYVCSPRHYFEIP
jgi:hypothetical protein